MCRDMLDMMPVATITEINIYFPDPWPKKREQKRRIIPPEPLAEVRRILVPGGTGIYVTDHRDYYDIAAPLIPEFLQSEARIPGPDAPARPHYEAKHRPPGRRAYG